jgi:hypothetical protein
LGCDTPRVACVGCGWGGMDRYLGGDGVRKNVEIQACEASVLPRGCHLRVRECTPSHARAQITCPSSFKHTPSRSHSLCSSHRPRCPPSPMGIPFRLRWAECDAGTPPCTSLASSHAQVGFIFAASPPHAPQHPWGAASRKIASAARRTRDSKVLRQPHACIQCISTWAHPCRCCSATSRSSSRPTPS